MDKFSSTTLPGPADRSEITKKAEFISKNWDRVRSILARELSEQSFKTWFEPLTCLDITDDQISLGVPDSYYGKWLQSHYQDLLSSAVKEAVGATRAIEYKVLESLLPPAVKPARPQPKQIQQTQGFELNSNYIFDSFVVGPGNRFAHAAAMAVSEAPARHYNPLFIHGPVGLGKTHLMQAIAHAIRLNNPGFRIQYISSEKFMNQLITAIQTRTTSQFRAKFRTLDLLLIDDIHFLAEKEATQEEFFHTFNTLYDAHKQIVVSSDRPPREIPGLEERLVSRFGWGLVTDIQPPNFETRVAILKKKMEKETVAVPDEVCYFIASKFKSNVRELEGALIRVVAYCALTGVPLTMVVVNQLLRDSLKEEEKKISMEKVQRVVASYFDLRVSDLRAKSRSRSVAGPRQIAMYLIRSLTDHSLPEIGEYFGGRDHSTVLHACQKIRRAVESDAEKLKVVEEIKGLLKS